MDASNNLRGYVWMTDTTALLLAPVRQPSPYTITMTVRSVATNGVGQTLSVYLGDDDTALAAFTMNDEAWHDFSFTVGGDKWRSGVNKLRFRASYLLPRASDSDPRSLAVAFKTITFNRR